MPSMPCCVVSGGPEPSSVKVTTPGGEVLAGVISVEIPAIRHNTPVKAKVEMLVSVDVLAQPLVDLEFIKAAAKLHGYRLVMVPQNGDANAQS